MGPVRLRRRRTRNRQALEFQSFPIPRGLEDHACDTGEVSFPVEFHIWRHERTGLHLPTQGFDKLPFEVVKQCMLALYPAHGAFVLELLGEIPDLLSSCAKPFRRVIELIL